MPLIGRLLADWDIDMHAKLAQLLSRYMAPVLVLAVLATPASAQKKDTVKKKRKHVDEKRLITADGWPIKITYYKHEGKRETPVVILLHSRLGDSRFWTTTKPGGFADTLWGAGFAVIAVDLRKHGGSKMKTATGASKDAGDLKPEDYKRMVAFDLEAVKKFIYQEHEAQNLNMRKTGIVAPEMSAPIALNFAAIDWNRLPYDDAPVPAMRTPRGQDIRAIILISPENSVKGIACTTALRTLRDPAKNIAFLFCVGSKDKQDKGTTKKLYSLVKGHAKTAKQRIFFQEYPYNLRGMRLIRNELPIKKHMLNFLKKFLLDLEDKWVDRKSRLE